MALLILLVEGRWDGPPPFISTAQTLRPIEVFADHNRADQTVTLYFTSALTGLSTPVTLAGFRPDDYLLERLSLTPNGVLYFDTLTQSARLALPSGQIVPHPFIPQQRDGLAVVDWILSPDRQSIAWVEVFPSAEAWLSNVYIADINGNQITPLPAPPLSQANPLGRFLPIALTNDRQNLFYDAGYPVGNRPASQFFRQYTELGVYRAEVGGYQTLPSEPACVCGGGVGDNGASLLRLRPLALGFELTWVLLNNGTSTSIPFESAFSFAQAGDLFIPDGLPFAVYSQAQNLTSDDPSVQFALVGVDFTTRSQRYWVAPSRQRFTVVQVLENGATLILAEVYEGGTYKFNLQNGNLTQLSPNTWLGTLYQ